MRKLLQEMFNTPEGDPTPSLSPKEFCILQMLIVGDKYGNELVVQSNGELKRGTVYVTLQRMEEKGFVTSQQEERPQDEGGLPRRRYRITGEGQRVLRVVERMEAFMAGGRLT